MAACATCNHELAAGLRWCGICHTNTVNAASGKLSSPGKRLAAFMLDITIPLTALIFIFFVAGVGASTGSDAGAGIGGMLSFGLFAGYVIWALVLFGNGTTPGKKTLGMRVMREDGGSAGFGTMFIREWIGKWISGIIFRLGYLRILFDRERQGWHDKLVSTFVVE